MATKELERLTDQARESAESLERTKRSYEDEIDKRISAAAVADIDNNMLVQGYQSDLKSARTEIDRLRDSCETLGLQLNSYMTDNERLRREAADSAIEKENLEDELAKAKDELNRELEVLKPLADGLVDVVESVVTKKKATKAR